MARKQGIFLLSTRKASLLSETFPCSGGAGSNSSSDIMVQKLMSVSYSVMQGRSGLKPLRNRARASGKIRSLPRPTVSTRMTCKELLDHKKAIEHPDAYREDIDTLQFCCMNDNVDELKGSVKIKKQWGLPVLNHLGNVVGVVTKHDLNTKDGIFVEDVMSSPPVAAHADDTLTWAVSLMNKYGVERLPVITSGDGHCVGMISREDIDCIVTRQGQSTNKGGIISTHNITVSMEPAMRHHNIDM